MLILLSKKNLLILFNKNLCKSTNINSNTNLDNKKNNNISHTDDQRKYKKKSNDKISCFKCKSNKKLKINNTKKKLDSGNQNHLVIEIYKIQEI